MTDKTCVVEQARLALTRAHAPYTSKKVGVCLETDVGLVHGASLENCAYPNSICACKAACVSAMVEGAKQFKALTVVNETGTAEPCGDCLELLSEYADDLPIQIVTADKTHSTSLREMLPKPLGTTASVFKSGLSDEKGIPASFADYQLHPDTVYPDESFLSRSAFEKLCKSAVEACNYCYVPMSHFPVGAALIPKSGPSEIVMAGNVENTVLGITLCAERSCLARSTSLGNVGVKALAVTCAKLPEPGRPCGGCRQSLVENGCHPIYMLQIDWENKHILVEHGTTLSILPHAFTPASL